MKFLKVDDKWSIQYDPGHNDSPMFWYRYGEEHSKFRENNAVTAMFYRLLEIDAGSRK